MTGNNLQGTKYVGIIKRVHHDQFGHLNADKVLA